MATSISDSYLSMVMGESIEKDLLNSATEGNWDRVMEIYKDHPSIHKESLTISGDTALHIAVSAGNAQEVEQMVLLIQEAGKENAMEVLEIGNELGNTPLHLAASQGNVQMCRCIAHVDPKLIGKRNRSGETPFFLAALQGKRRAFLCLHSIMSSSWPDKEALATGYSYSRRRDGDTILHCAISRRYFDMAFQIINRYENLVHTFNEKGLSPLHLLASNPSVFPSGSPVRGFEKIIYHMVSVSMLEVTEYYPPPDEKPAKYPENYQTCLIFARMLGKFSRILCNLGRIGTCKRRQPDAEDSQEDDLEDKTQGQRKTEEWQKPQPFPPNYSTCFDLISTIVSGLGIVYSGIVYKMKERRQKHVWSLQIMHELLQRTCQFEYVGNAQIPQHALNETESHQPYAVNKDTGDVAVNDHFLLQDTYEEIIQGGEDLIPVMSTCGTPRPFYQKQKRRKTPILLAAKHGVVEMVKKIIELFPVAIHDMNSENKNVVLLAVENRQPHVYIHLLKTKFDRDSIFRKVDRNGNSALHLAAKLAKNRSPIPGAAFQMQWEIKWFEFVKNSMPRHFFVNFNKRGKTPKEVFTKTHKKLVKNGGKWLGDTSYACSAVASAIAALSFATSSNVPDVVKEATGMRTLAHEPPFYMFAVSSLAALGFSVTALIMFVSILTSSQREQDFRTNLPSKLLLGLTSLFISVASMLISLCGWHLHVLKDELKFAALPVYAIICFAVTYFAVAYFPFYFDLIWGNFFRGVPERTTKGGRMDGVTRWFWTKLNDA